MPVSVSRNKRKHAWVRRNEEELQANTENDSGTDEYDVAKIDW